MCLFFHKWSRWSETKIKKYRRVYIITNEGYDYTTEVQTRHCEKCGLVQEKEVKNV